ncbi:MAG: tol-pal system-associated acyl-CoA thioesterase [Burkholderiales bacterium]|nr:MAG: tol-pal system-associated acyl-CoA thioesterase [Burkholderiales bacterium]
MTTAATPASTSDADFATRVRVYYEDTDAGGIVYYANYLRYFERARTDWLRALGIEHRRLAQEEGIAFVVRDCALDYRLPARLDDELRIEVTVREVRRAWLRLAQRACALPGGTPLVCAELRIAAIRQADGRPTALPRALLEKLAP